MLGKGKWWPFSLSPLYGHFGFNRDILWQWRKLLPESACTSSLFFFFPFLHVSRKMFRDVYRARDFHCFTFLFNHLQDTYRTQFIQQLRPVQSPQPRIKLKLFGHVGSGKTTLIESLKCGLIRSFFRRRRPRLSSTNSTRFPSSPLSSKTSGKLKGNFSIQYFVKTTLL